jgi:hypothetical protein
MEVVVEDREHEAQVDRHGSLAREQRLDALLDAEVGPVDLVVERDHLVGQLDVGLQEGVQGAAERPEDVCALLLERRLELIQLFLERDPHPNLPVT